MHFLLQFLIDNKSIFIIFTIIVIYLYIYYRLVRNKFGGYVNDNWNQMKNKPYIVPFAGFFGKGEGNSKISKSIYSFNSYIRNLFNSFIRMFIKPFVYFINLVKNIIKNIKDSIDKFRNMAAVIRQLFRKTVESTAKRIQNSYAAVVYFQEKFKLILRKQAAMFTLFQHFSQSMKFLMHSYLKGPVPKMINFVMYLLVMTIIMLVVCMLCIFEIPFVSWVACPICAICFDKNTLIKMTNNTLTKIKNLKLGDTIMRGGEVKGIIKVLAEQTEMYKYNDNIVSGSHLVFENKWIRVEDSKQATLIEYDNNNILHCLITDKNFILTNNATYADYQETSNPIINNIIQKKIAKHLNKGPYISNIDDLSHQYYWGFVGSTQIDNVSIENIKIGDIIQQKKIKGIVKLSAKDIKLFNYKGILVSGSQLICEEDLWIRVHQSKYAHEVSHSEEYIYHLIISGNKFKISNIEFTDFCESCDDKLNYQIDYMVEKYLNGYLNKFSQTAQRSPFRG